MGLTYDDALELWPLIEPLIEKPLVRTGAIKDFHPADILELIKSQAMQCWLIYDDDEVLCVAITQILAYPRRKVLGIPFVGAKPGTIKRWLQHMDVMEAFAIEHGCTAIRGWGRKGWEKVMNPDVVRVEFDIEV